MNYLLYFQDYYYYLKREEVSKYFLIFESDFNPTTELAQLNLNSIIIYIYNLGDFKIKNNKI